MVLINVMIRRMLKVQGNGNVLAWYFIGLNVCYSKASSSEEKYQFIVLSDVMVNNYHWFNTSITSAYNYLKPQTDKFDVTRIIKYLFHQKQFVRVFS